MKQLNPHIIEKQTLMNSVKSKAKERKQQMNHQISINGQMFDAVDEWVQMDREALTKMRLEDIPQDVNIRCDATLERWIDIGGIRNLGEGNAQVFVRFGLGETAEALLSDYAYEKGVEGFIFDREAKISDVCLITHIIDALSFSIVWAGITVSGNSVEEMFEKALKIADEIAAPFEEIEKYVYGKIFGTDGEISQSGGI